MEEMWNVMICLRFNNETKLSNSVVRKQGEGLFQQELSLHKCPTSPTVDISAIRT